MSARLLLELTAIINGQSVLTVATEIENVDKPLQTWRNGYKSRTGKEASEDTPKLLETVKKVAAKAVFTSSTNDRRRQGHTPRRSPHLQAPSFAWICSVGERKRVLTPRLQTRRSSRRVTLDRRYECPTSSPGAFSSAGWRTDGDRGFVSQQAFLPCLSHRV